MGGWVLRAARQPASAASCQRCTISLAATPPLLPASGLATLLQNFSCKAPAKDPAQAKAALAEPRSSGPNPTPLAFKFPPPRRRWLLNDQVLRWLPLVLHPATLSTIRLSHTVSASCRCSTVQTWGGAVCHHRCTPGSTTCHACISSPLLRDALM